MPGTLDDVAPHPLEKGHHQPFRHPHIFVDGCAQVWPDAEFSRLQSYGCTAFCVTSFRPDDTAGAAFDAIAEWWRVADSYENVVIALRAEDIREAKDSDRAAIVLVSQGGDFLGQGLHRLDAFHRLGLRMMIPAYNTRSPLGDGCWEPANCGLSRLGVAWVDACNRLGVVIDLTHVSERTSLEVMERSEDPVVFSHSNPKQLVDSPRNITDEQIRLCVEAGGVVGVTNWGPLNFRPDMAERPKLEDFLRAVEYVIDIGGVDSVGIGTDMSVGTYPDSDLIRGRSRASGVGYASVVEASPRSRLRYVEGFDDYSGIGAVIEAMTLRGYHEDDIAKLLGGNFLRVFGAVWGG